jgi:hypothetical protein
MKKLILMSVLLAPFVLAARAAKVKNPRTGLRKFLTQVAVFNFIYLFLLLVVWTRL